jgi:hypothetical protein
MQQNAAINHTLVDTNGNELLPGAIIVDDKDAILFGQTVFVSVAWLQKKWSCTGGAVSQKLQKWKVFGSYVGKKKMYPLDVLEEKMRNVKK